MSLAAVVLAGPLSVLVIPNGPASAGAHTIAPFSCKGTVKSHATPGLKSKGKPVKQTVVFAAGKFTKCSGAKGTPTSGTFTGSANSSAVNVSTMKKGGSTLTGTLSITWSNAATSTLKFQAKFVPLKGKTYLAKYKGTISGSLGTGAAHGTILVGSVACSPPVAGYFPPYCPSGPWSWNASIT